MVPLHILVLIRYISQLYSLISMPFKPKPVHYMGHLPDFRMIVIRPFIEAIKTNMWQESCLTEVYE